ncbi:hypothetical protein [Nonomuraea sp. NPDC023979]|uniref:hypothetical protein n=1 Tax=Nonomuraea sp. NPDC023979 TaxID=3154796 RepID=UPI003409C29C
MSREGQTIQVGEGYPVVLTRDLLNACNTYGWATILHSGHPGEGYEQIASQALNDLYTHLRAQVPHDPSDESTSFPRHHLTRLAAWLGNWDLTNGCAKGWPEAVPIRTTMDIPLNPPQKTDHTTR